MARGANRSSRNLQATLRSREHNARCQEHFHNFVAWVRAFDDCIRVRRPSARVASKLLFDCIQFLYDDKRSLTHAVYTVVGIQNHYHQLRRHLRPAWDAWSELSPSTTSLLSDLLEGCEEELQPPLAPASAFLPQRVRCRRRRL